MGALKRTQGKVYFEAENKAEKCLIHKYVQHNNNTAFMAIHIFVTVY